MGTIFYGIVCEKLLLCHLAVDRFSLCCIVISSVVMSKHFVSLLIVLVVDHFGLLFPFRLRVDALSLWQSMLMPVWHHCFQCTLDKSSFSVHCDISVFVSKRIVQQSRVQCDVCWICGLCFDYSGRHFYVAGWYVFELFGPDLVGLRAPLCRLVWLIVIRGYDGSICAWRCNGDQRRFRRSPDYEEANGPVLECPEEWCRKCCCFRRTAWILTERWTFWLLW